MIDLREIRSLSEFQRNTKKFLNRLKKSGRPHVLTVKGRAELVVQDVASYQKGLELLDRAEAVEGIHRGLESMRRGEGRPLDDVLSDLRKRYRIPRRA